MNHKLLTKAALAAALSLTTAYASATTTLCFSHFWPATSAIHKEVFQAWADDVEKASNGELKVHDGPYADTREQLAGYFFIDVDGIEQAVEWANRCPSSKYGAIEIRPIVEQNAS